MNQEVLIDPEIYSESSDKSDHFVKSTMIGLRGSPDRNAIHQYQFNNPLLLSSCSK